MSEQQPRSETIDVEDVTLERERGGATRLDAEELVVGYGGEPIVDGASLSIPAGAVTALVGPNGSGKSTLLSAIADQLEPEAGRVLVDGESVQSMDDKRLARRMGVLSQDRSSPEQLSVEDLAYHGRYPHQDFFASPDYEDHCAVENALQLAGVEHLRDRTLGNLSGGQCQLAWIAMVLAQDTDVLLLDEPTTYLDLHHQLAVLEVVETLRSEYDVTVVVVLHDVEQAVRYADHLLALDDGEIRSRGEPADVVTEELLADVFGVEATVEPRGDGVSITPHGPIHSGDG